jgi:hypothetical protein
LLIAGFSERPVPVEISAHNGVDLGCQFLVNDSKKMLYLFFVAENEEVSLFDDPFVDILVTNLDGFSLPVKGDRESRSFFDRIHVVILNETPPMCSIDVAS